MVFLRKTKYTKVESPGGHIAKYNFQIFCFMNLFLDAAGDIFLPKRRLCYQTPGSEPAGLHGDEAAGEEDSQDPAEHSHSLEAELHCWPCSPGSLLLAGSTPQITGIQCAWEIFQVEEKMVYVGVRSRLKALDTTLILQCKKSWISPI